MTDVTPPAPEPTPAPAPPAYTPAPAASDGKTLGIVALILAFFIQLAGLIVGIIARNQSKRAGVKNTPATVAIVLSIIFMVVGIIAAIALIAGGGALFGGLVQLCAEYGPGEHILPDGTTLTCG